MASSVCAFLFLSINSVPGMTEFLLLQLFRFIELDARSSFLLSLHPTYAHRNIGSKVWKLPSRLQRHLRPPLETRQSKDLCVTSCQVRVIFSGSISRLVASQYPYIAGRLLHQTESCRLQRRRTPLHNVFQAGLCSLIVFLPF